MYYLHRNQTALLMSGPLKNVLRAYPSQLKLFVVDVVLGVV
jgi:hypothetical protein